MEITDPRNPRLLAEYELDRVGGNDITQPELGTGSVLLHDVVVKRIDGRFVLLASYWDGGYVQLDVTDPARAAFIDPEEQAGRQGVPGRRRRRQGRRRDGDRKHGQSSKASPTGGRSGPRH